MLSRTCALAVLALALLPAVAGAHAGNPNMLSVVKAIEPRVDGVTLEVLNRDDRLELTNRSGQDIVIEGYEKEPYARVLADGTVQVNDRSSATYLNGERFGGAEIPDTVDAQAEPVWRTLDRTGRFEWHDHRMHYMVENTTPPQVEDESVAQKVNDWSVPIAVAGSPGTIAGELLWTPTESGGMPTGAIIAFVVVGVGGLLTVLVARRRRGADGEDPGTREAW